MSKPEDFTDSTLNHVLEFCDKETIDLTIIICNEEDIKSKQDRKQLEELSAKGFFIQQ